MTAANSIFTFRRFRTRLLVFLLCLLVPVLGFIFYYVNSNNNEYTEETINSYLQLGADVFDFTRQQQTLTLQAITNSLTWDFGFRTAYAAQDPATLFDAALNVLDRSENSVDMLMITDLDYEVIIDTELQGLSALQSPWLDLLEKADASSDGYANAIVIVDGNPYQIIALPLYLPRQVAWIVGGFALDAEFVQQVKETTLSEISIIRSNAQVAALATQSSPASESALEVHSEVIVSTLSLQRQQMLAEQIEVSESSYSKLQRIAFLSEEYTSLLRPLYTSEDGTMEIVAVIQRSYGENSQNVEQFRALLIQFYLLVLVLSLIAVVVLARSITRPVSNLAEVVSRIEAGNYDEQAVVQSWDEIGELAQSVNSMAKGLAEKEKVRDLLGKVVSHQIAEELLNNPVELGGEERTATILFSDIRGFTSFCEGLSPAAVLTELNKVLSTISDIVEVHDGVVDKYQGDAVMALFGVPIKGNDDAGNAMAAALEIIQALKTSDTSLEACVGINTGIVVAGNLGSSNRLNYSVIGDTVNLSARLESLTRLYNVSNIVSKASAEAAPQFCYRELDEVRVAGKSEAVVIMELLARQGELNQQQQEELTEFEGALASYKAAKWDKAQSQFSQLQQKCDNRPLCQVYLDRIEDFKQTPPPSNWNGIFTFGKK